EKLAEEVEKETDGEVTIDVNHNGVLGSEHEEMQQMQEGNLDMALIYGVALFEEVDDVFGVEDLPFIYSDIDHARNAHDGEYGDAVKEKLSEYGFEVLAYWENGFRH